MGGKRVWEGRGRERGKRERGELGRGKRRASETKNITKMMVDNNELALGLWQPFGGRRVR